METRIFRSVILTVVTFVVIFRFSYTTTSVDTASSSDQQLRLNGQSGLRKAYATFLSTRIQDDSEDDVYFTATRVLNYQILHQPHTRTRQQIPFLVLVPPHVSANKTKILATEGATIVQVPDVRPTSNWTSNAQTRWVDQFTKLNVFGFTQYDRILYIDADMLLTGSLDEIFNDPIIQQEAHTTSLTDTTNKATNNPLQSPNPDPDQPPPLPSTYLIAGVSGTGGPKHTFPPRPGNLLSGGFFLLKPDQAWLAHYISVLNTPYSFDSKDMEQSLLNHVHNLNGAAPWLRFEPGKWNTNWPNWNDIVGGTKSLHDKFWEGKNQKWIDRRLVEMWWKTQGRMEGFWQGKAKSDAEGELLMG